MTYWRAMSHLPLSVPVVGRTDTGPSTIVPSGITWVGYTPRFEAPGPDLTHLEHESFPVSYKVRRTPDPSAPLPPKRFTGRDTVVFSFTSPAPSCGNKNIGRNMVLTCVSLPHRLCHHPSYIHHRYTTRRLGIRAGHRSSSAQVTVPDSACGVDGNVSSAPSLVRA